MSDDKKDSTEEKPEQLTDEQLDDVVGAGKFTQARIMTAATVGGGVGNDTIFASPGTGSVGRTAFADIATTVDARSIKGIDKLKR